MPARMHDKLECDSQQADELMKLGRPGALPHRAAVERAFGTPLGDVPVRLGAGDSLERIGVAAATTRQGIVFTDSNPHLDVVVHEVTHVLQNRQAAAPVDTLVGPTHGPAEQEAAAAVESAAAGESPQVSAAPGGAVQYDLRGLLRLRPRGRNENWMQDQDVDPSKGATAMGGGTLNATYKVGYKNPIGPGGTTTGIFKSNIRHVQDMSGRGRLRAEYSDDPVRSVQSSRLAEAMGFDNIAKEQFATHTLPNGAQESGSVSAMVPGSPMLKNRFKHVAATPDQYNQLSDDWDDMVATSADKKIKSRMVTDDQGETKEEKTVYKASGAKRYAHDYAHPQTQKDLSDLQLFDAIAKQDDRHGGNIFIDPQTGRARGIDNDRSFGKDHDAKNVSADSGSKYIGLPDQVDKGTAKRLLKLKAKDMPKWMKENNFQDGNLSKEEIKAAQSRFRGVKTHLKDLKRNNQLVSEWNDDTYQHAINAPKKTGTSGNEYFGSYVQDAVDGVKNLTPGDKVASVPGAPIGMPRLPDAPARPTNLRRRQNPVNQRDFDDELKVAIGRRN